MKKLRLWFAVFPMISIRGYFWASSANDVRTAISDSAKFNAYRERGEIKLVQRVR